MIIMALDHVRDFTHWAANQFQPENVDRTWPALFFTRWITHFCAPVFMFTAGLGAFLWMQRKNQSKRQLSWFLLTRGLWLIVLELTLGRWSLFVTLDYNVVILVVLWVLGACMIILAGLIHLPTRVLAGLSIAAIALHNLLDGIPDTRFGRAAWVWDILHFRGQFHIGSHLIIVGYQLLPWFAVMALGYCCGGIFLVEPARRKRLLVNIGLGMTAAFVVLRAINVYGDPSRWAHQKSAAMTLVSFLDTTKYPPSLLFLLMTLGLPMAAMGWLEGVRLRDGNPFLVFGRTPLFYFVIHMYVAHFIAIALASARYHMLADPFAMRLPGWGYNLPGVYLCWATVVVVMYPLCRWFAGVKRRRRDWWLSYL